MHTVIRKTLVTWLLLFLLQLPVGAEELPANTIFEVRLSMPSGSHISQLGEEVEGRTIAPIFVSGRLMVPQGSRVLGSIEGVKRYGLGLKQTTAQVRYRFNALVLPNGETVPLQTQLIEVDAAKERVDMSGTVHGIHPAVSLSASLSWVTVPLLFAAPIVGVPVFGVKAMIAPSANPEIYFPAGTELILRLTAPAETSADAGAKGVDVTALSAEEKSEAHRVLERSEQRASMGRHPSDFVNLMFLGSRSEMDKGFRAAGWSQAEAKSPLSLYRMYHALSERVGYRRAPMNTLRLNGEPSAFVYQKSLDTVQKRHHVRVWKAPQAANVWLGAAAEDIAFRFEVTHWTHSTAPKIDNERAKVVNDLAYTGCLQSAGLLTRKVPRVLAAPKGERPIATDGRIAVVRLNNCGTPQEMPGVTAPRVMNTRRRVTWILTSLRNDLRLNLFFTTYNSLKLLAEHRKAAPLRKVPNTEFNPPGLSWLSSLEAPERAERAGGEKRVIHSAECCGPTQLKEKQ